MKAWSNKLKSEITDIYQILRESRALRGLTYVLMLLITVVPFAFISNKLEDYALNAWTESLSIIAGVLLIDRLRSYEDRKQYQLTLKRQARSRSGNNAIDAIEIVRDAQWLTNEDSVHLLAGTNLDGAKLSGANLRRAYLSKTEFKEAELNYVDFQEANLLNADLRGAKCTLTKFAGANLAGVKFHNAEIVGCEFLESQQDSIQFETKVTFEDKWAEEPINFSNATIYSFNDINTDKPINVVFSNLSMRNAVFNSADLHSVEFESATLDQAKFIDTTFHKVSFINAKMTGCEFSNSNSSRKRRQIQDVDFTEAELSGSTMYKITFVEVDMKNAILDNVDFTDSTFRRVNLEGANLYNASLEGAKFENVRFSGNTKVYKDVEIQDYWERALKDYIEEGGSFEGEGNVYKPVEEKFHQILAHEVCISSGLSKIEEATITVELYSSLNAQDKDDHNLNLFDNHVFKFEYPRKQKLDTISSELTNMKTNLELVDFDDYEE